MGIDQRKEGTLEALFGQAYDIELLQKSDRFQLRIQSENKIIYESLLRPKEEVIIPF